MTVQQTSEAIFEEVFADIAYPAKPEEPQAEILNRIFRHLMVTKIKRVLEKCQ